MLTRHTRNYVNITHTGHISSHAHTSGIALITYVWKIETLTTQYLMKYNW